MRKRIAVLCLLGLLSSMTACQSEKQIMENSTLGEQKTVEVAEDSESDENALNELFDRIYEDDETGISIGCPSGYDQGDDGWGYSMSGGDMDIFIVPYKGEYEGFTYQQELVDLTRYTDSTQIFDLMLPVLMEDYYFDNTLGNTNAEIQFTKEINGVEMTKFQGTVAMSDEVLGYHFEYPMAAYGIKGSKGPVLVIALQTSEMHGTTDIEEWKVLLDDMVKTYKEEE